MLKLNHSFFFPFIDYWVGSLILILDCAALSYFLLPCFGITNLFLESTRSHAFCLNGEKIK